MEENLYNLTVGQKVMWKERICPFFPESGNGTIVSVEPSPRFVGEFILSIHLDNTPINCNTTLSSIDPGFKYLRTV